MLERRKLEELCQCDTFISSAIVPERSWKGCVLAAIGVSGLPKAKSGATPKIFSGESLTSTSAGRRTQAKSLDAENQRKSLAGQTLLLRTVSEFFLGLRSGRTNREWPCLACLPATICVSGSIGLRARSEYRRKSHPPAARAFWLSPHTKVIVNQRPQRNCDVYHSLCDAQDLLWHSSTSANNS